jgi:peptide/nickel transport system substrate-binding protein
MRILLFPFKLMLKLALVLEKLVYEVRDAFWSYPEFFSPEKEYNRKLTKLYISSIPYTHFGLAAFIMLIVCLLLFVTGMPSVFGSTRGLLIEAVVMGQGSDGNVQKINRINPILPSNIQLEKDLVNLIYEPLLRYHYVETADGTYVGGVETILADEIITLTPGANYEFRIKQGIHWHDSRPTQEHYITADDVIATFELYSDLSESDNANVYSKTVKQLQWRKIDEYTVRVCTKPTQALDEICDVNAGATYPIFSNFLELVSFKIVPARGIGDITPNNASSNDPRLYRSPVGTGLYKLGSATDSSITLEINNRHPKYNNDIDIRSVRFEYYRSLDDAMSALQTGEVHGMATLSTEYKDRLTDYSQISISESDVLFNQFWGLYFNLRTRPDGSSIAPEFILDSRVRRAISSAINRRTITEGVLRGVGREAQGPIPDISYYFNPDAGWHRYDQSEAESILSEAGWTIKPGDQFRTNDRGQVMRFSLYFVDNYDRKAVAQSIKADLADIGIDVIVDRRDQSGQVDSTADGWTLQELNEQVLSPGLFDVILYGMQTFVDPDRYELYHSSQTRYPGLNIAGYVSIEQTVDKREDRQEGESSVIQVPRVDRFLDLARSFNPEQDREARRDRYFTIQTNIASDAPVVYLYHPQFLYFHNSAIGNISLSDAQNLEDRFLGIENWEIK